jgi:wobble nucleotide-excising tRNase
MWIGAYEKVINGLLTKFGASFQIEKMNANFLGGSPRTEYGIKMRGKSVAIDGGTPRFSTSLSDGDKRTLAFAFFVASNLKDADIGSKILIVDDPMCSLDLNRKNHTRVVLGQLHARADQLIVLAHDAFFIRDLRDELTPKDGQTQVQVLQMRQTAGGYTSIEKINIDHECESSYIRHHRTLSQFSNGSPDIEVRAAAKALRPFLEGYIHRRFPNLVPKDMTFGLAISFIKNAVIPHPVAFAQPLAAELGELNDYAAQFHHDTNPDADSAVVMPAELKAYCDRALHLVYSSHAFV